MRMIIAALLLLSVGCYSESPETRYHNLTEMINDIEGEVAKIVSMQLQYERNLDRETLRLIKADKVEQLSEEGKKNYKVLKDMDAFIKELRERQDKLKGKRGAINL